MIRTVLLAVILLPVLGACAHAPQLPDETGTSAFVIERDLAGPTVARGTPSP